MAEEKKAAAIAKRDNMTMGDAGFAPANLGEAIDYAKLVAQSAMVPKAFQGKPENVLVAMQMGAELGLAPLQSLQNIAVINGRPSVWGDALLALVMARKDCVDIIEECDGRVATCVVQRAGKTQVKRTFSIEDAKAAGLWGTSGPWSQHPKRMLQMRARAFALRDSFPDVLRGLSVAEEAGDIQFESRTVPDPSATVHAGERPKRGNAGLKAALGDTPPTYDEETGEVITDDDAGPALVDEMLDFIRSCDDAAALKSSDWSQVDQLPIEQADEVRAAFKNKIAILKGHNRS